MQRNTDMTRYASVPWRSWEEWMGVHRLLNGLESPSGCRDLLRRLEAWRVRGGAPPAVVITEQLVQGVASDFEGAPPGAVEALYSFALVRFTNGILDSVLVMDGGVAEKHNLRAKGRLLGVPEELIALRNEVCHGGGAALPVLRRAARLALDHLRTAYWERQASLVRCQLRVKSGWAELLGEAVHRWALPDVAETAVADTSGARGGAGVARLLRAAQGREERSAALPAHELVFCCHSRAPRKAGPPAPVHKWEEFSRLPGLGPFWQTRTCKALMVWGAGFSGAIGELLRTAQAVTPGRVGRTATCCRLRCDGAPREGRVARAQSHPLRPLPFAGRPPGEAGGDGRRARRSAGVGGSGGSAFRPP
eukprot:Polyplicarium_translucidae@DN1420_c0_g1_i1.p2